MEIGRRIYFNKATGEVFCDTGERAGSVIETTVEEEFGFFPALQGKTLEEIDYIQLDYGEYADKFAIFWPFTVDTVSKEIIWDSVFTPPQ